MWGNADRHLKFGSCVILDTEKKVLKTFLPNISNNLSVSLKAVENFAWNIRVIKGQGDLLLSARQECLEYLRQVSAYFSTLLKSLMTT